MFCETFINILRNTCIGSNFCIVRAEYKRNTYYSRMADPSKALKAVDEISSFFGFAKK
jgi:hypothetical protein